MAQMTGADAEDLERGANSLEAFGKQVGGMRKPLWLQLNSSPWTGTAADTFRREWGTRHGPALSEAEEFLRQASRTLRSEAAEQRRASTEGARGRGFGLLVDGFEFATTLDQFVALWRKKAPFLRAGIFTVVGVGVDLHDLFFQTNGYDGEYHAVETIMDFLSVGAAGVVIGATVYASTMAGLSATALAVGALPVAVAAGGAAAAAAPVIVGAILVGGAIYAVDKFLATQTGKAFMGWTANTVRAGWRATTGAVRSVWNRARSIGESGARAIRDSAVGVARTAVDAGRKVADRAVDVVDRGGRLVSGALSSSRRLLSF